MKTKLLLLMLIPLILGAGQWESFELRENGTIPVWLVAGPLPNEQPQFHGEMCFGYYFDFLTDIGGESNARPKGGELLIPKKGKSVEWKTSLSQPTGLLDYIDIFQIDKNKSAVAYAFCQLKSSSEQQAYLKIRSNDGVKAWFNGKKIHENHVGRSIESEEDVLKIALKKGENPLLIKVDQGGGDWGLLAKLTDENNKFLKGVAVSVFTETLISNKIVSFQVKPTPLIKKTPQGDRQIINAEILSGGLKNVTLQIAKNEWKMPRDIFINELKAGKQIVQIDVPVITETGPAQVLIQSKTDKLKLDDVILYKSPNWTAYLVQHVHTDIGYTRPQTEILPEHLRFIDWALDFCDLTDNYPNDAQFRWTCEVTWAVREYLKRRPKEQIERLKKRIAEGRIEIAGMFLNMSELSSETALAASLLPVAEIRKLGLPVQSALQNDVNGAGWCLVDYFSDAGIKYLSMGINKTRSILPFDRPTPFWWESPSGKRILAYRADHYHVGNMWGLHEANLETFGPRFLEHIELLESKKYPFKDIVVQYSGYRTDNSPPSTLACDLVKTWNETYSWPKLRIATVHEFLQKIEKKHSAELPIYRAAWPDWWTDGFGSAARETAEARITQNALEASQGLLSMASLLGSKISANTVNRISTVQDELLFYQEHTFGAAESINDPMAENSLVQWGEKSSYVWNAVKNQGLLREEALGLLQEYIPKNDVPTIAIFNTLSWQRSGLVTQFIDHQILPRNANFQIVDCETGVPIRCQPEKSRSEGTYWNMWVDNIPPMGWRTFKIIIKKGLSSKKISENQSNILENSFYKLEIDDKTGAIKSLFDKELNQELVDDNCQWKLGQFIYETIPQGREFFVDKFIRSSLTNVKIAKTSDTELWKAIHLSAQADGFETNGGILVEFRLYNTEKRLELLFTGRKSRVQKAEACYVSFPFQLPDSKIIYEAQGGLVTPGVNQLPGSSSDWHTVQNFAVVRNQNSQIIFGSPEIPLVQFGEINLGKWQYKSNVEQPHIYSWPMNNYWFTNFRAFQEGEFKWSYFLTSTKNTSNKTATQFGRGACNPLISRVFPAGANNEQNNTLSTLQIPYSNILLVNARPIENGIILHLRETDGKSTDMPFNNMRTS
jgi:alpha-mannosidase